MKRRRKQAVIDEEDELFRRMLVVTDEDRELFNKLSDDRRARHRGRAGSTEEE
jgi:hypothetical protein